MEYKRLTARMRERRAVEDNTPYPGSVNQPERKFKRRDEYDLDWETTNHPFPDMRTDWRSDSRDEIGFGIPEGNPPTVASLRVAASKAVRLAVLLLGDKVADEVIEEQARDLMALSQSSMDRTLQRFAETQELYAQEEEDEDEAKEASSKKAEDEKDEEKKDEGSKEASSKKSGEMPPQFKENAEKKKEEAEAKKDDEKKASDDKDEDDKDESKEASKAVKAEDEKAEEKKDEEKKEASTKKAQEEEEDEDEEEEEDEDEEEEESKEASSKKAQDDEEDEEEVVEASSKKSGELDIELTAAGGEEAAPDPEADARLAAILFGEDPRTAVQRAAAKPTKKAGIKKLGGQPKVASSDGVVDIDDIWVSAPDVREIFG